ncbi:13 kda deflagellation-inducible [Stylonychia lemnae]|uniref:13 kDa deflagellation-inducible n=1 Tax=Stylonychia lemnae TaxID=5949 RepID=A0A078A4R9_STYLE|nr:13 kda deflagellation-inducible [Stylonychia lemnae]|eukprot:CDW76550.1 13 kda deflagellation-inducible [Stylonychia lemnae]
MSEQFAQGATLQRYNQDLSRYIENIRVGRDDLHEEIIKDEEEKHQIESEIASLTERLGSLSDALLKKYEAREEFDRTISETEQAFMKILESSQTLLHVLKKEDSQLSKKKFNVSTRKISNNLKEYQQSPEKKPSNTTRKFKAQPVHDQSADYSYDNTIDN